MNPISKEIPALLESPEDVYVVHFSHGATNNRAHFCPRIFCIYVQNMNGSESIKFSIENIAIKQKVPIDDIIYWYDELELSLLDEFDAFLRSKNNCTFIYWVEDYKELILDVIKSRFEELNKVEKRSFCEIPIANRKSIHFLVCKIERNVSRDLKRFINAFNKNTPIAGFLSLAEEQQYFEKKDFSKIGASVVAKVSFFVRIIIELVNQPPLSAAPGLPNPEPFDIRPLTPKQLFKNLNVASWLIIGGAMVSAFTFGMWLNNILNNEDLKDKSKKLDLTEFNLFLTSDSLKKLKQSSLEAMHKLDSANLSLKLLYNEASDSILIYQEKNKNQR